MMKKVVSIILCILLLFTGASGSTTDSQKHEQDLEYIFLGNTLTEGAKNPKKSNNARAVLFGYLEDAIYLCIDQMGNEGQKWLDELNEDFQMEGLPKSINEITVPVYEHERYTHMGWDYKDYPLKEKWALRQNILLATVSKVFGFPVDENKTGNERYTEQCIDMAKLIYYIHILGDHERNKLDSSTQRIQLKDTKQNEEYVRGLIYELRKSIGSLLRSRRNSYKYSWMMVKLSTIRFRTWITGEEDNERKHTMIQSIAHDTLQCLRPQLRNLLLEMEFYQVLK